MILCIFGDRQCKDKKFLDDAIKASKFNISTITEVIHGDCYGADHLGRDWGKAQGLIVTPYPADWDDISHPKAVIKTNDYGKYDASAGNRRNAVMAEKADCFIGLQPNSSTPGSSDMIKCVSKLGKPLYVHTKQDSDYEYKF